MNFGGQGTHIDGALDGKNKTYSAYMLIYVRTTEIERIYPDDSTKDIPKRII